MPNGSRSMSSISRRSVFVNCKAKDFWIKFAYFDYSTWLKVNRLIHTSLLFHCVVNGAFDANLSQSNTHNYTCLTVRKTVCYRATKYVKQTQNKLTESRKSNLFSTFVVGTSLPDACDKKNKKCGHGERI